MFKGYIKKIRNCMLDCCCDVLVSKYFSSWLVVGRSVPPFVPQLVSNAGGRQTGKQATSVRQIIYNTDYLHLFPGSPSYVH